MSEEAEHVSRRLYMTLAALIVVGILMSAATISGSPARGPRASGRAQLTAMLSNVISRAQNLPRPTQPLRRLAPAPSVQAQGSTCLVAVANCSSHATRCFIAGRECAPASQQLSVADSTAAAVVPGR